MNRFNYLSSRMPLACALLVLCCAIAAHATPLQVKDLIHLVQLGGQLSTPIAISPDGTTVAYVTATPQTGSESAAYDSRGPGRKALWIVKTRDGSVSRVGDTDADDWAPVWSPDGERLAFYSGNGKTARVMLWDAATAATRALNVTVVAEFQPSFAVLWVDNEHIIIPATSKSAVSHSKLTASPESAFTVLTSMPPKRTAPAHSITAGLYRQVPVDLALLDVTSGLQHTLDGPITPVAPLLSPSRRYLVYFLDKGMVDNDVNSRELFDAVVIDLQQHTRSLVASDILTNFSRNTLAWSHTERYLAYVGGLYPSDANVIGNDQGADFPGHLYLIDIRHAGSPKRIGTQLLSRNSGPVMWSADDTAITAVEPLDHGLRSISLATGSTEKTIDLGDVTLSLWDPSGSFHASGGKMFAFALDTTGRQLVYDVDPASWRFQLLARGSQNISQVSLSADGRTAAYVGEDVRRPPDVWVTNDGFAKLRQLTHLNPRIETSDLSGDEVDVSWQTHAGMHCHGNLLLPADYQRGKRYPMITWIYGGEPEGTKLRNRFGSSDSIAYAYMNLQLFASRGYAVFVPDTVLHIGTPMTELAAEVLPGIDRIVAMGIADPARLGVYGQSYGGYSTLALIVQTHRFKAAVAMSGVYDLVTQYGFLHSDGSDWTGWAESEQGRMGGTPWQYRARYIENSPFFYLDRVTTPVLLEYGDADDGVSPYNSRMAFVGLRRLGKTATLIGYAGEGHVVNKPSNQQDLSNRILAWFATYMHP